MAATRKNILTDETVRDQYVQGARLLKQEFLGTTTQDLGIAGPVTEVSTYDLFVAWHHISMSTFTPPTQGDRNAAHRGPVFLPWHRFMLILLELQFQRVLGDGNFGIPYWDWAADGELSQQQQVDAPIWGDDYMGGQGDPVTTGPFAFDAADPTSWRVRIEADVQGQLRGTNRGLRRVLGQFAPDLPQESQVKDALTLRSYDTAPWDTSTDGFRNRVEGWRPAETAPGLHNRVHVWVGGDMLPSSSPNDPVFYLNHCNEDRIWAAWQTQPGALYLPDQSAPADLLGHRIDDPMYALLSDSVTPRQMLEVDDFYSYDALVH
jgi:tyrosinase